MLNTQEYVPNRFGYGKEDKGFHVGEKPWYAIGTQLVDQAPTLEEGIKIAGLDWTVDLQDLQTEAGVKTQFKGVMRSDNNECLGAVTKSYTPLQNTDAFKFFEPFIESGYASLDAAGSFRNGRKVWILAKINKEDIVVSGEDRVQKYIILSNSHDGGSAVRVGYTPYRISCQNTLTVAENSNKSQLIRVRHGKNVVEVINSIQKTMNIIDQTFVTTQEKYRELAKKEVNKKDLAKYVQAVFSKDSLEKLLLEEADVPEKEFAQVMKDKEKEEISVQRQKLIERVEEIFEMEYATHKQANAWTAYNSVNYILNHERGRNTESAYNSLWFESASILDRRALALANRI